MDAMDTAAIHTTAPLPASAAGTKRARSPSREGCTGDAQGTSAEADAASDSDEPDVCCPGVTRAAVVADPNGGELYASDVVAPPPNQLGGATYGPTYGGARPSTCVVQYKTDKLGNVCTVWANDWCAPSPPPLGTMWRAPTIDWTCARSTWYGYQMEAAQ